MPILSVYQSYPLFFDKNGNPLDDGDIYVGTAGSNAVSNQIQAYFDSAKTIAASQPINTNAGYPINPSTGARSMIYVDATDFSLVVRDKNGVTLIEENNITDLTYKSASASDDNATDIATNTADIATNTANIATNTSNISTNTTKLAGIEAGADVTDATNVNAAGATMNTDTDVSGNSWVLDEDDFSSDSNTKVPTQQSTKAYVDSQLGSSSEYAAYIIDNQTDVGKTDWTSNLLGTRLDVTDPDYSASTFNFQFQGGVHDGTVGHYTHFTGTLKKEASGNPKLFLTAAVDQWSGVYAGEVHAEFYEFTTSGSAMAFAFLNSAINAQIQIEIERVDSSNELCFRINTTFPSNKTACNMYFNISGPRNYSGTLISSSNGTTF